MQSNLRFKSCTTARNSLASTNQIGTKVAVMQNLCYQYPVMVLNPPQFYKKMLTGIKDASGNAVYDSFEMEKIVENAMLDKIPILTAKKWAISNDKKGAVAMGKNENELSDIASMAKVCTAYTVCRIMEELDIYSVKNAKNIYLRVSQKAAYIGGTSAFIQTDNRISLYDCLCGLMLPSGNDAAIVLATEFGRWLYMIGDMQKDSNMPQIG